MLVQLDDELGAGLDRLAERLSVSMSELLRRGAIAMLEAEELRPTKDSSRPTADDRRIPGLRPPSGWQGRPLRVVARTEIYWAELDRPIGRRPVCVLSRQAAIFLNAVTCAPVTGASAIRSEVEVGAAEGLPRLSAINSDGLLTIPKERLDPHLVGRLEQVKRSQLDRALRYALDIRY